MLLSTCNKKVSHKNLFKLKFDFGLVNKCILNKYKKNIQKHNRLLNYFLRITKKNNLKKTFYIILYQLFCVLYKYTISKYGIFAN